MICCMKELSDKKFETPVHFCYADLFLSITKEKHIKIQSEFIKIVYGILTKAAKQLEEKNFCFKAYIGIIVLYNNKKTPSDYFCKVDLSHNGYCLIKTVCFSAQLSPFPLEVAKENILWTS